MEHLSTKIGKYTLVNKIGDGGMAEVFKAKVQGVGNFEKLVAIKKILPHLATNEKFRRNFINEARICGQLHHHNIVEVYDFLQQGTDLYLTMEFIDGLSLEDIFSYHRKEEEPLPTEVVLSVMIQILDGLEYAHKATDTLTNQPLNIIHRDLKPSNILIDREGVVKIVDFGVAKAANRQYETTELTAKGTASYMAPEQLLGDKPVTQAADMFSVGAIFYELLTLRRLFDGDHVFAILKQVATLDIESYLDGIIGGTHRKFLPILKKSLMRDPKFRYPIASLMLRDVFSLHIPGISARKLAEHMRDIQKNHVMESEKTRQMPIKKNLLTAVTTQLLDDVDDVTQTIQLDNTSDMPLSEIIYSKQSQENNNQISNKQIEKAVIFSNNNYSVTQKTLENTKKTSSNKETSENTKPNAILKQPLIVKDSSRGNNDLPSFLQKLPDDAIAMNNSAKPIQGPVAQPYTVRIGPIKEPPSGLNDALAALIGVIIGLVALGFVYMFLKY